MSFVLLDKLEELLGRKYDSNNDTNLMHEFESQRVRLVVEYFDNSNRGMAIGIRVGNDPMRLLGRIVEFSAHATSTSYGLQAFKAVTKSRECADTLSLFYPLTHVIYEPISYTREIGDWGALLVPDGEVWQINPDYEVLGILGGVNAFISLRHKKTQGIIEVPITPELEQLIPNIV